MKRHVTNLYRRIKHHPRPLIASLGLVFGTAAYNGNIAHAPNTSNDNGWIKIGQYHQGQELSYTAIQRDGDMARAYEELKKTVAASPPYILNALVHQNIFQGKHLSDVDLRYAKEKANYIDLTTSDRAFYNGSGGLYDSQYHLLAVATHVKDSQREWITDDQRRLYFAHEACHAIDVNDNSDYDLSNTIKAKTYYRHDLEQLQQQKRLSTIPTYYRPLKLGGQQPTLQEAAREAFALICSQKLTQSANLQSIQAQFPTYAPYVFGHMDRLATAFNTKNYRFIIVTAPGDQSIIKTNVVSGAKSNTPPHP